MNLSKKRLDQILLEQGYYDSREKARTAIMSNYVKVAGQVQNKAGTQVSIKKLEENPNLIEVQDKSMPYVSRGAYKLEKAHQDFKLDFKDKVILDLGASTGGFTDYSLQNGAKRVIAIDVGKGQLAYKIRDDKRILNIEGKNVKDLKREELKLPDNEQVDMVVADLSFISITKILENLKIVLADDKTDIVFLIKPQFEAGKKIADKFKGVITDETIRNEIVERVISQIEEQGYKKLALTESPIKGAKGNVEFLAHFRLD